MSKKILVIAGVILLPGILAAQLGKVEELQVRHNEFSVSANFINMKPMNDYIRDLSGFSPFLEVPLLFGYAQKNRMDEKTYWGLKFMTTLSGVGVLEPNFLKREIMSAKGTDRAEMSITMVELLFEYEFLRFGGLFINGGLGLGIGGSKITLLGTKNGRFWTVSFLSKPQARVGYHFFEEAGGGFILSFNTAYNYLPVTGWNPDGGDLQTPPPFDLSGVSLDISITFPFTAR